ncbi:MAG TPA: polysaccharide pyruvyl transferase family protein, partial [Schlesneria sp.]
TGENTGNLLIGQSLFEELQFTEYGCYDTSLQPCDVNERYDVIVIAAANFIFRNFDLSALTNFIESTKLPCVIVGLGAQAPATRHKVTDIPEGSRRFLHVMSDRSNTIGVRGYFTAEVMNDFGIKNVRAVGCPSLYRSLTRDLKIVRPDLAKPLQVSLNGSRNVIDHAVSPEAARRVEAKILMLSIENGYDYVLQNEDPEMQVLWSTEWPTEFIPHIQSIVATLGLDVSENTLINHIRSKNRLFFELDGWDKYISRFDYSLGTRFHGNLIALTNGVAATIFTHDSRTTELAELMSIPHVPVEDVTDLNVNELATAGDYDRFERKYQLLYDRFAEFLNENGLNHKLVECEKPVGLGGKLPTAELAR